MPPEILAGVILWRVSFAMCRRRLLLMPACTVSLARRCHGTGAGKGACAARVAGDDDDVGEVGQPEEILDHVDGQTDVRTVLRPPCGRGEQLGEVDGARHELALVARVHGHRPVGVGAVDDQGAE